ncbi:uncharacterized protein DEA37_0002952 [Paragonimus westermani]|uniref:Uncharacterized protein n=1 Tax=Paragonimus westermani TaxID=34504 RepID=A0A5J4NWL8_9TREM|nr:uncharacterized protein DEA37_0002952 [Paragonimus westermani]
MAFESPPLCILLFIKLFKLWTQLQIIALIYGCYRMIVLPVTVVLVALLNNVLAQNGTPAGSLTSTFKGLLAYNLSLVKYPGNLTKENWTRVRTDVCEQPRETLDQQVRRQIVDFLRLSNISDSNIHTEPFGDYENPEYKFYTRVKANITIENSMLAANRINYTCSSFRQLIKACLGSPFFYSETAYIGRPVKLLDGKIDENSANTTTNSPTSDRTITNNGSVATTSKTISGGVVESSANFSLNMQSLLRAALAISRQNDLRILNTNSTHVRRVHLGWLAMRFTITQFSLYGE